MFDCWNVKEFGHKKPKITCFVVIEGTDFPDPLSTHGHHQLLQQTDVQRHLLELLSQNRKALTKPSQLELFGKFVTCKFNQMAVPAGLKLSHEAEKILEVFQNAYKLLILQKTMTGYNP